MNDATTSWFAHLFACLFNMPATMYACLSLCQDGQKLSVPMAQAAQGLCASSLITLLESSKALKALTPAPKPESK